MKITRHFTKRFIQRVLKREFNNQEFYEIHFYLEKMFEKIKVRNIRGYFVMPGHSDFVVAYEKDIIKTLLKKEWVKDEILFRSGKISKKEYKKLHFA